MEKQDIRDLGRWVYNSALEYAEALDNDGRLDKLTIVDAETVAKQTIAEIEKAVNLSGLNPFDAALTRRLEATFIKTVISRQAIYRRFLHEYSL